VIYSDLALYVAKYGFGLKRKSEISCFSFVFNFKMKNQSNQIICSCDMIVFTG